MRFQYEISKRPHDGRINIWRRQHQHDDWILVNVCKVEVEAKTWITKQK